MVVGLIYYKKELGSTISCLEALYAIKHIYNAKIIVFGNDLTKNLFSYCDYIDVSLDMGNVEEYNENRESFLETINANRCDYLLSSATNQGFIKFLLQSNARFIICNTKIYSFLSIRCKTIPTYTFKKYRNISANNLMLHFARKIKPRLYDKKIASIDLNKCDLKCSADHDSRILSFLHNNIGDNIKSSHLIMINPFNVNCRFSLTLDYWLKLMESVAKSKYFIPLVVTYPAVHEVFMQALNKYSGDLSRLVIYSNNNDILNLLSMIKQCSCVISPSTGTIHLASNLNVRTIGLYAKWNIVRWGTKDGRYVYIPSIKEELSDEMQNQIVEDSLNLLQSMFEDGTLQKM